MGSAKRERQRANRAARLAGQEAVPSLCDTDLDQLLAGVTVRVDCEHASTRTTDDGPVLTRCAVGASVTGGCPRSCGCFEARRVDGSGTAAGT